MLQIGSYEAKPEICFISIPIRLHNKYSFIHDQLVQHADVHPYATRNSQMYVLPRFNIGKSQKSLLYAGIKIWNEISGVINCETSFSTFKRQLISFYSSNY